MPGGLEMRWDYQDALSRSVRQRVCTGTPPSIYYVYDSAGRRVRKVCERPSSTSSAIVRQDERIYVGAFEIHRRWSPEGKATVERQTLRVTDDRQTIALLERRVLGDDRGPSELTRYQLPDHLGSVSIEVDSEARLLTYEEYYPYGATAYEAARVRRETPKRYRYTGKEHDAESGLYCCGSRYYAPWLARWVSCDPAATRGGVNLYPFARCNPINNYDPDGRDGFWHNAWETVKGVGEGIGAVASGVGHMVAHPIDTVEAVGHSMSQAYHQEGGGFSGVLMAANQLNPAYHAMVAGYETYQAYERHDYRAMGHEGFNTAFQTASTIAVAVGGAGLVSRGLGLGTAGTTGAVSDAAAATTNVARAAAPAATDAAAATSTVARTTATAARSAAPQVIRTGTEADLITVAQETGTATGRPLVFSVTEDATESSVTLGYRHRAWGDMGHNLVGVTTEGQTSWFHLSAPKGGTGAFTVANPVSEGMLTTTLRVSPEAAAQALRAASGGLDIGTVPWTPLGYNCATTATAALGEAGVTVPFWARTPLLLHVGLRYGAAINGTALVVGGEGFSVGGNPDRQQP
jgi:RHS repeat-associated protein